MRLLARPDARRRAGRAPVEESRKQQRMSADGPISLPGSRVLLGWWHELAPLRPRRLWYAHALLHRVEALIEAAGTSPLEQFQHALLGILATARPASREALAGLLRFP